MKMGLTGARAAAAECGVGALLFLLPSLSLSLSLSLSPSLLRFLLIWCLRYVYSRIFYDILYTFDKDTAYVTCIRNSIFYYIAYIRYMCCLRYLLHIFDT